MLQGALWNVVVIDFHVVAQSRFKLGGGAKAGLVDELADTAIEAFNHAVRLRVARRNEAMLDLELFAQDVKHMLAGGYGFTLGFFLPAGKTVGELTTIVGEQLDDF